MPVVAVDFVLGALKAGVEALVLFSCCFGEAAAEGAGGGWLDWEAEGVEGARLDGEADGGSDDFGLAGLSGRLRTSATVKYIFSEVIVL